MAVRGITSRGARFQQWQSLLTNRTKRRRAGEFVVQGVRPITLAVRSGWPVHTLIHSDARPLSRWAEELLRTTRAERVAMAPDLLAELGEKDESAPELVAVVGMPDDDLDRIPVGDDFLGVVFDRPTSPGNVGSVLRSADALGAHGLVVTGHAADVYDPKAVRASTGSLFALPAVRVPSHREVIAWLEAERARGGDAGDGGGDGDAGDARDAGDAGGARDTGGGAAGSGVAVIGTDEGGGVDVFDVDLTRPTLLLVGNETAGLSAAWRERCDQLVSIPMRGSASSLNAANAATAVLYEAARQRLAAAGRTK